MLKVAIAGYALMGFNEHVIMLDCWRRWKRWIVMIRTWRSIMFTYRQAWVITKGKIVFQAWRNVVHPRFICESGLLKEYEGTLSRPIDQSRSFAVRFMARDDTTVSRGANLVHSDKVTQNNDFMKGFFPCGFSILRRGIEGKLDIKPNEAEFLVFGFYFSFLAFVVIQYIFP